MINSIGQDTVTAPTATPEAAASQSGATAAADFQTFLSLLTTQLRNQDPLQPMDSTEFVAQLASFSAVEQQIETNTKLDSLLTALSGSGFDSAVQWIAKDVEVQTDSLVHDGQSSVQLGGETPVGATSGELTISDSTGAVIKTIPLGTGPNGQWVTWDGMRADGTTAPAGTYTTAIAWKMDEETIEAGTPLIRDQVREVRFDHENDTLQLTLESGLVVPVESVTAIMRPGDGAV